MKKQNIGAFLVVATSIFECKMKIQEITDDDYIYIYIIYIYSDSVSGWPSTMTSQDEDLLKLPTARVLPSFVNLAVENPLQDLGWKIHPRVPLDVPGLVNIQKPMERFTIING